MAKTNYTKVEEALDEGMRKMMIQHLHTLTDSLSNIQKEGAFESPAEQKKLITLFKVEMNWIEKQDPAFHQKINMTKADIKKLKELKEPIKKEDFEKIKEVKEKIDLFKKEMEKNKEPDDLLVEKARKKQINKRFNTNDNWLPLH